MTRRARFWLVGIAVLAGLFLVAGAGVAWWVYELDRTVTRIPGAFEGLAESERPEKSAPDSSEDPDRDDDHGTDDATDAAAADTGSSRSPEAASPDRTGPARESVTFLVGGTDRRSSVATTGSQAEAPSWIPGAQRTDSIMLVHITADRSAVYVVSIPRDAWVDIPGHGMNKVNAAFSFAGPSLFVHTIESLTDTRVDHLAVVDWAGLVEIVDSLGGVRLTFDEPTVTRDGTIPAGTHVLSGDEVLSYIRTRKELPNGDFDRVKRQQNVMRSVFLSLLESGSLADPVGLARTAKSVAKALSVDEDLGLRDMARLAYELRDVRRKDVVFLTAPTAGVGWEGSQSVVYLDRQASPGFWRAFRGDSLERWIRARGISELANEGAVN